MPALRIPTRLRGESWSGEWGVLSAEWLVLSACVQVRRGQEPLGVCLLHGGEEVSIRIPWQSGRTVWGPCGASRDIGVSVLNNLDGAASGCCLLELGLKYPDLSHQLCVSDLNTALRTELVRHLFSAISYA